MRTFALLLLAACGEDGVTLQPDGKQAPPEVLDPAADGLIAHYTFDDDPADGIVLAERGHHATCRRCPATASGVRGNALAFSNRAELVQAAPTSAIRALTAVTGAAWLNIPTAQPERSCFLNYAFGPLQQNSFQICIREDTRIVTCVGQEAGGQNPTCIASSAQEVTFGEWVHVAVTFDGSVMRTYVNASEVASTQAVMSVPEGSLTFGADLDWGAPVDFLTGRLDEAKIWNRALTGEEMAAEAIP